MTHHVAPMGDAEKRAIIVRLFAALEAGDFAAATAGVAEDFVQEWPQSGERISGREHSPWSGGTIRAARQDEDPRDTGIRQPMGRRELDRVSRREVTRGLAPRVP